MWHTHNGTLFSLKRGGYLAICDNLNIFIFKVTVDFWLGQDGESPIQALSRRLQMKLKIEDKKHALETLRSEH